MTNSDWVATGALLIALISLLFTVRAYYLSKKEHHEKYQEIIGYLINAFKWEQESQEYVSFAVSYTNKASSPNSFNEALLEIEYFDNDGFANKARLSPQISQLPSSHTNELDELIFPLNIGPKESYSGWLTFLLPTSNFKKFHIDSYKILTTTPSGEQTTIKTYLIKKVMNDE
jgi:hypothetical protein